MKRIRITIAGAGEMGHGLAIVHAQSCAAVSLYDRNPATAIDAMGSIEEKLPFLAAHGVLREDPDVVLKRISLCTDFEKTLADTDILVESISESPDVKHIFYKEVGALLPTHALILSNTSALNVFALAEETLLPRLFVAHHFSPAYLLPLVELVGPPGHDSATIAALKTHFERVGCVPVILEKFTSGFIVNKLQHAMAEAIYALLEEGVASPRDIDVAVKASMGIRLPVLGVVQRLDFAGLGLVYANIRNKGKTPPKILENLVENNALGVKTRRGFYDYTGRSEAEIIRERDESLVAVRNAVFNLKEV